METKNFKGNTNKLGIDPICDETSTDITQYSVIDFFGNTWMIGTKEECEDYLNNFKTDKS